MYYFNLEQLERLDELAVENGLEIRQMMELAGWHMVTLFGVLDISAGEHVLVACGKGNKGGDGLSAARHLVNNGYVVTILLLSREITSDAKHHLNMAEKMGIPIIDLERGNGDVLNKISESDVIIDALIGYHLSGPPHGAFGDMARLLNESGKKIISYDIPSGVLVSTGQCLEPCVRSNATLSLAVPKEAFRAKPLAEVGGEIYIADIGIPAFIYDKVQKGSRPEFTKGLFLLR